MLNEADYLFTYQLIGLIIAAFILKVYEFRAAAAFDFQRSMILNIISKQHSDLDTMVKLGATAEEVYAYDINWRWAMYHKVKDWDMILRFWKSFNSFYKEDVYKEYTWIKVRRLA